MPKNNESMAHTHCRVTLPDSLFYEEVGSVKQRLDEKRGIEVHSEVKIITNGSLISLDEKSKILRTIVIAVQNPSPIVYCEVILDKIVE